MLNVFSFRSGELMLFAVGEIGEASVASGNEINSSRVMSL